MWRSPSLPARPNPRFHLGPACTAGQPQVVFGLEVEPELRSHIEIAAQAESGAGGDVGRGAHAGGGARRVSAGHPWGLGGAGVRRGWSPQPWRRRVSPRRGDRAMRYGRGSRTRSRWSCRERRGLGNRYSWTAWDCRRLRPVLRAGPRVLHRATHGSGGGRGDVRGAGVCTGGWGGGQCLRAPTSREVGKGKALKGCRRV